MLAAQVATLAPPTPVTAQQFNILSDRNVLLPNNADYGQPSQGLAIDDVRGWIYVYMENANNTASYVTRFPISGPRPQWAGSTNKMAASTSLGHQGLSVERATGKLWSPQRGAPGYVWRYDFTTGSPSGDAYGLFVDFAPTDSTLLAVSYDGKWLIGTSGSGTMTIRIWDLAAMLAGGAGDYSAAYVTQFAVNGWASTGAGFPLQAIISDGKTITMVAGYGQGGNPFKARVYSLGGALLSDNTIPTVGQPWQSQDATASDRYWEPEGLAYGDLGAGVKPYLLVSSGETPNRFQRVFQVGAWWNWNADTMVDNFSAASTAAGVTLSAGYRAILKTLYASWIQTGVYNYLAFYYPWNAPDGEAQSRVELINPGTRTMTKNGTLTWTAKAGYTGSGNTANYLSTNGSYQGWANYGKNRAWMGVRGLSTAQDTGAVMGSTGAYNLLVGRTNTDTFTWRMNSSGSSTSTAGSTTCNVNFHLTRPFDSTQRLFVGDTQIASAAVSSTDLDIASVVFLRSASTSTSNQWANAWGGFTPTTEILAAFNAANDAYVAAVAALP